MTHRIETTQEVKTVTKIYLPSGDVLTLNNMSNQDAMYLAGLITNDGTLKRLREQVAAQASVIERMRDALNSAADKFHDYAEIHSMKERTRDNIEKIERNLDMARMCDAALSSPTNSTQILDEVLKKERERCAKVCESHPDPEYTAVHLECARRILEME